MKNRLKLFVLPRFQIKLFLAAFIPFCISLGFLFFQFLNSISRMNAYVKSVGLSNNADINKMLSIQQNILTNSIWLAAVVGVILMGLSLLIISHKLAGPLNRMQSHLKEIRTSGKVSPLMFRDGDYIKIIESDLNHCLVTNFETDNKQDHIDKQSA